MARTLEEGGSTEVELHAAAVRAVERWNERAATRSSTVSVDGEPVTRAGERHRHRPDPRQPARERHDLRAGSDRAADGHRGTARVHGGARPRPRHPSRGTDEGHRAVLSRQDRSPRRLRPGSRDRGRPGRAVGRRVLRAERRRRRHPGRGAVPCRLGAREPRPTTRRTRDADTGAAVGRSQLPVGVAGSRLAATARRCRPRRAGLADLQPGAELLRTRHAVLGRLPAPRRDRWSRSRSPAEREATTRSTGSTGSSAVACTTTRRRRPRNSFVPRRRRPACPTSSTARST